MNVIKSLFYKLLQLIDDGRFLIKPMKWFYYFKGVVPFLIPVCVLYFIFTETPRFLFLDVHVYNNAWAKILVYVFGYVFIVYLIFLAYIIFLFWVHRAKRLEKVVRKGDAIVAIPLFADNVKNNGEIFALFLSFAVIGWSIMFFVFMIISGAEAFYTHDFFENVLILLAECVGSSIVAIIISFFIIMVTHFIAERLRLFAQMCNDLRDVADIHRAATIQKNTDMLEQDTQLDAPIIEQQS